jgi:hypothetical protein
MTTKKAVITAVSVTAAATILFWPWSGARTRRGMGRGIWWGMRALGGNLKSGGRAVGKAGYGVGGKVASMVKGRNKDEDFSGPNFADAQGQAR